MARNFCVHRLRLGDNLLFEILGQGQMSHWGCGKPEDGFRSSPAFRKTAKGRAPVTIVGRGVVYRSD